MDAPSPWSAQQLAEFLAAVSVYDEAEPAMLGGLELIAEAFESEISAVVQQGNVLVAMGFPKGKVPRESILAASTGELKTLEAPGVGACEVIVVPLEVEDENAQLLLARSGAGFSRAESSLLRAMARVLSLTLQSLRVLASLRERQILLENLAVIQRSISLREPIANILEMIASSASQMLGGDFTGIYFLDSTNQQSMTMTASHGVPESLFALVSKRPVGKGVSGLSLVEDNLVVIEDYPASPDALADATIAGVHAAMAAPVHDHGDTIGSLVATSLQEGRRFSQVEREMLLSFAEHASLAITDAKTVEALHTAVDSALQRALHDPLTGLANRTRFFDRLAHALAVRRQIGREVAVLYVDLDDFKQVNDRFGHAFGDRLLIDTAKRLVGSVEQGDTVARIGGDEFAVLLENTAGIAAAEQAAGHILESLSSSVSIGGTELVTNASIGIEISGTPSLSADEMLRNADVAMYRAKRAGKGRALVFESEMYESLVERIELETDLRRAVQDHEIDVYFQPIVSLEDEQIVGVEALARWIHPVKGDIPPLIFIPVAEETGLIVELGRQILQRSCAWIGEWQRANPQANALSVSVNVSAWQLQSPDLENEVINAIAEAGILPNALILEITESVLMQDTNATLARLDVLSKLGVRLALDDFGTGFSSLSYLQRFPVDILKIDRSFVAALRSGDETVHQLTEAMLVLGSTLGLQCVAEGIEHVDELRALRRLGCALGQGWYFAPAIAPNELSQYLATHPPGVMIDIEVQK